ncbi:hypothetical protein [Rheinheimera soli]|uniref:Uncharacterized protein n=1 Tax=Rheinheimera soli TaxID=443616 RepID=A0ABU1W3D7_9GAMM|nr:hypothetical protein [Rheinheimera soli]MDR7122243.1 hypothetical protein [Rheinheimera soli]
MAKVKWTPALEEKLYLITVDYFEKLQVHDSYTQQSHCIQKICEELKTDWITPSSVLYRLAEHKFLKTEKHSLQDQIFYKQTSAYSIQNFKICPKLPHVDAETVGNIISAFLDLLAEYSFNATEVCNVLGKQFDKTSLNIQKIVFDNGLIEIDFPPRKLRVKQEYVDKVSSGKGCWKSKSAPPDLKIKINNSRSKLGEYYNPTTHKLPAVIRSSDGTGFGKSYSVFNAFINNSVYEPGISHRCFVFITPQKSQIDITENLIRDAVNTNLPILPVMAHQDMRNLDFIDWVDGISNEKRFLDWISKGKKCPYMKNMLLKLEQIIYQIRKIQQIIKNSQSLQEGKLYEQQLQYLMYDIDKTLVLLALCVLNQFDQPRAFEDLLDKAKNSELEQLRLDIVSRVFPFQRALFERCVLVLTTDKFEKSTYILNLGKDGLYRQKLYQFDELIGGSRRPKLGLAEETTVSRDHNEQVDYLREHYFSEDKGNPFVKKGVAFTLIIDEEHESYERMRKGGTVELVNSETNLPHVISGLHRAYKAIQSTTSESAEKPPLYDDIKSFFNNIERALALCELPKNQSMLRLFELFQSNIGHVQIDRTQAEQILNITRNLFNFSPKHFFNENTLKNIKIASLQNNTFCKLYYSTTDQNAANLYDLYLLVMSILDAASKISNRDVDAMLGNEFQWSQNSPLSRFIDKARENRDSIQYLFERAKDENLLVNHFFTYFQPKTIFSLEPKQKTEFRDPKLKDFIYVDLTLSLLTELPETTLMRVVSRSHNAVYLLSATTGFHKIYNGNFNYGMLRLYGEQGSTNLAYSTKERSKSDMPLLQSLRDARQQLRTVNIHNFDTASRWVTSEQPEQDFARVVKAWEERLQPGKYIMISKYRRREFQRTLHAVLLAAYDKKSSLVLTLSKRFFDILRNYVDLSDNSSKRLTYYRSREHSVYTFKPFDNGNTLRLICFDAKLANTTADVSEYTYLSPNETLVMVAAYKSAGTGLNFFVRYVGTKFKEDFTRLILVNSPYYSEVRDQKEGLNTLDNWLTLLKFYADGDARKYLADFDVNLVNGENYHVLEREHQMSIFKKMMQAIGRVEREDTLIDTEIHIPSDLMDWAILHFSRLNNDKGSEIILGSMSLLNTALMHKCLTLAEQHSFSSDTERKQFESVIFRNNRLINSFFENTVIDNIKACRHSNVEPKLNEALRSIDCVFQPSKWINDLKNLEEIKTNGFLSSIVNGFFIDKIQNNKRIIFCRSDMEEVILTDLSNASLLYSPADIVLPPEIQEFDSGNEFFWKKYHELSSLRDTAFDKQVPHPAIIPLIKGNIGEYLLDAALEQIGVQALSIKEVIDKLPNEIYESFDRYIELHGELFCIDAKNWSSTFDQKGKATETVINAEAKANHINKVLGRIYHKIHFIYVNARLDQNPLNLMAEYNGSNTYFFNLLKRQHYYDDPRSAKAGMSKMEKITLNPSLWSLFDVAGVEDNHVK